MGPFSQLIALYCAFAALIAAAACVFAIRSLRGTFLGLRFAIAAVLVLAGAFWAVRAVVEGRPRSWPRTLSYLYDYSPLLLLVTAGMLLFSVLLLGYAIAKRPRNLRPTA